MVKLLFYRLTSNSLTNSLGNLLEHLLSFLQTDWVHDSCESLRYDGKWGCVCICRGRFHVKDPEHSIIKCHDWPKFILFYKHRRRIYERGNPYYCHSIEHTKHHGPPNIFPSSKRDVTIFNWNTLGHYIPVSINPKTPHSWKNFRI